MQLTHDFNKPYHGFWNTGGLCRIRIYEEQGRKPVVICSQLPNNDNTSATNTVEYLAAEIVEEFLPDLPDSDVPFFWVQHYPPESLPGSVPEQFSLVTFSSYQPFKKRTGRPNLTERLALGEPAWEKVSRCKVDTLIGKDETYPLVLASGVLVGIGLAGLAFAFWKS